MEKPNVLYILADDLGWGDVSYHGSVIKTPNIDRLARDGVELDHHYVSPVCTPTRTSLMTGRFPGRFGKHATIPSNDPVLPDGYYTLASMFQQNGYATGLFGKWHLGSDPEFYPGQYGFDYSYGSLAGGVDPYTHRYKTGPHSLTWHRNKELIEEQGHVSDLIASEAIGWIKSQSKPWFCYLPFTAVHTPIKPPESWIDRYMGETYDADPERDISFKRYAAYASHMDYCVGQMVEMLKCTQQLDHTIIVFASDNGAITRNSSENNHLYPGRHEPTPRLGSNLPLRGRKTQMYEGGIRTPAAIYWPGRLQPGKLTKHIHIADWMPTFAALLDITPPVDPEWDGVNIFPLISGETDVEPDRILFWNLRHKVFAVRKGAWKLILNKETEAVELFNIEEDPYEEKECAHAYPLIVRQLTEIIQEQHQMDNRSKRADVL